MIHWKMGWKCSINYNNGWKCSINYNNVDDEVQSSNNGYQLYAENCENFYVHKWCRMMSKIREGWKD